MDIKKIGGTPTTGSVDGAGEGDRATKGVQKSFDPSGVVTEGERAALDGIERVVVETVDAVRSGDLAPEAALDNLIDRARGPLAATMPPSVDIEKMLEYIRETLEQDPTFMSLVKGG